jgi:UDP-N-acetylmuramoyl-L-alanyl-D-glutamate--2,6-diaminopimelate ligase
MKLNELLGPEIDAPSSLGDIDIRGLTADSRAVAPGWLFAALPGSKADGARFIPDAVAKGAAVVLAKHGMQAPAQSTTLLTAAEPRRALAMMAARFYRNQPATTVAVTGTSGKTSVAEFTRQIFAALGRTAASLGTIGIVKADGARYGGLTTPDPVALHETLAGLAGDGITHLALEASSHSNPRPILSVSRWQEAQRSSSECWLNRCRVVRLGSSSGGTISMLSGGGSSN